MSSINKPWALRWIPIIVTLLSSAWAVYYVIETQALSLAEDEPDTSLFINFLLWPLLASAIFVIVGSLRDTLPPERALGDGRDAFGLGDRRRIYLVLSLPIFAASLSYGGFLIPSILYGIIMAYLWGIKKPLVLIALASIIAIVVWIGFAELLGVPLKLWPV